jgi:hypothetical protein
MILSYLTWFSVELLHEYFNKDTLNVCSIVPAEETKQNFNGSNMLMRFIGNKLYVLVKEENKKPFSPVDNNRLFRFYIKCNDPAFFNYSNIKTGRGIYYLSNLAANEVNTELSLSLPPADYDPLTEYQVGTMVTDTGTHNVFECLQKNTGVPLNDTDTWVPRADTQFVADSSLMPLRQTPYRFTFPLATTVKKVTITINGFKVNGTTLTEYEVLKTEQVFPNAVSEVQADITALSYGRYKVSVDAITSADAVFTTEEFIYYDLPAKQMAAIAVIEIFNHLPDTDAYSMVNNLGEIKETNYTIRFANRYALWKYIAQTTNINAVTGAGGFTQIGPVFISNNHLAFKQIPDDTIELALDTGPPTVKAPFPSPSVLKSEKEADGSIKNFYTEIYLNY